MYLVISLGLLSQLLLKPLPLHHGVIQLSVGIHHLLLADEELKALCEARNGAVPLGEWAHDLRVVGDEGRADTLHLDEVTNQLEWEGGGRVSVCVGVCPSRSSILHSHLVHQPGGSPGVTALHSMLHTKIIQKLLKLCKTRPHSLP